MCVVNMKCAVFVLLVLAWAGAGDAAATTCSLARDFFIRHRVPLEDSNETGPLCGGACCGRGQEEHMRRAIRGTAELRAAAVARPVAELLLATRRTLQDHLTTLSHQAQNKTAGLFSQVYRGQAPRAHAPLAALYDDLRAVLLSDQGELTSEDLKAPPPRDLAASTRRFFRELFPVAYHNVLRQEAKQFKPEYEACLKDAYDAVQPFGDVPQQLGSSLTQALSSARVVLQVLSVGAGALSASERVLSSVSEECAAKLTRMGGCARCRGLDVRPCQDYCLNVARGCLGSLVSELDAPWAGYVEGVERLIRLDADAALRAFDTSVSKAIMHVLENQGVVEKKVRHECGAPSTVAAELPPLRSTPRRDSLRAPPPDTELLQFAATLASSKKLFATIADRLCEEPDLAHVTNKDCWNGESVGEYNKGLVASSSLHDQRYNPEVSGGTPPDARVASLGDRLRQATQLLEAHSSSGVVSAEAYMQRDEAGGEESGSGGNFVDDDANYDAEGSGEGSGHNDIAGRTAIIDEAVDSSTPKTGAASSSRPLYALLSTAVLAAVAHCLT